MPKPLDVKLDKIEFTFGGLFTFDVWQSEADLRARLSLESRDEPRERWSNFDSETGIRKTGELP